MKGERLIAILLVAAAVLSEARKFNDEFKNKAIKNTRRVQQSYGSTRQIYFNFGAHFWRLDMRPPALEVGWEFVQSQPLLYKGVGFPTGLTGNANNHDINPTAIPPVVQMKAYKMRLRLRAKSSVYIKSSLNIDRLFYNELIFDMDEFLSFVFGDIIIVYNDQSVSTAGTAVSPLWIPPWVYNDVNICWALGYNYNDLSMSVDTTFKFPNCYKMIINSLTDWSQWANIITKFGSNSFLFGLLDQCTMSDDNPVVTAWETSVIPTDSGDLLFFGNDIFAPTLAGTSGAGTPTTNQYFYNTPKANINSFLGTTTSVFPTSCLF